MSVAIPIIDSIDGANRRIYLKTGVSNYFPIEDLYHEYRYLRRTDEALRKWEPLLKADGNVSKGDGRFTPRYVTLLDGTKIVPFNEILQINQLGEIITDNPDVDPTIYDVSGLTVAKPIFIQPSEAEIINLDSEEIKNQSYLDGRVFINTVLGTVDGIGTPTDPVNDFQEAYAIAISRRLNGYKISGNISLDNADVLVNGNFSGESSDKANLTLTNVDVDSCVFEDLSLDGTISSGRATYKECELGRTSLTGFDGIAKDCSLPSNLTLSSSGTKPMMFRKCFSAVPGSGKPVVDCNGVTQGINFREQSGGLQISNFNGGGDMSIDAGGVLRLVIDSSCTAGTIIVGGTVLIDDQSGVGCTVIRSSMVQDIIYRNIDLS